MARRVIVDQDECIGCGTCEGICPEVFQLNEEEGKSEVIKPEGGPKNLIEEAIGSCPVGGHSLAGMSVLKPALQFQLNDFLHALCPAGQHNVFVLNPK